MSESESKQFLAYSERTHDLQRMAWFKALSLSFSGGLGRGWRGSASSYSYFQGLKELGVLQRLGDARKWITFDLYLASSPRVFRFVLMILDRPDLF